MLTNYLKIAFRSLWKNSVYSFINVIGLAIGIAASVLILLYVSHEYSFDKFHKNADRLYRVLAKVKWGENEVQSNAMSAQFGPRVKEVSSEVANYTRTRASQKVVIQSDAGHRFFENRFLFADSSFFSLFSFDIIRGSRSSLARPNTVMITEDMARKYFGDSDPVGKILTYDKVYPFEITGVIKNVPSNSSLQFDFIGSLSSLGSIAGEKESYHDTEVSLGSFITYIQVKSENSPALIEQAIPSLMKKDSEDKYSLEPFTAIYFNNNFNSNSSLSNTKVFLFIALLILTLALANYINLTTARGTLRAKEVGIRKTIGAQRTSLSAQFYTESALTTLLAFGIAMILIETLTPPFLQIIQQDIDSSFLRSPLFIGIVVILLLACILLSGGYPALFLSRFRPAEVLKGKLHTGSQNIWLRKGFILFQFTTSMALIICSLVVQHQLSFMQSKNVGLNKDHVVVVNFDSELKHNFSSLKEEIKKQSDVISVAASSHALYNDRGTSAYFTQTPTTHEDVLINVVTVDEHFFSTLGIEWVSKQTDSIKTGDYIINEMALEKLKITEADLGVNLKLGNQSGQINGIVKDFNYSSLRDPISGIVIAIAPDTTSAIGSNGGSLYVRLNPKTSLHESIDHLRKTYNRFAAATPFHYYFLDDAFNQLYQSEDRLLTIVKTFTGIAIFIACLGLFGLITFSTERKMKEIGIRKILGASVNSILTLISREFIILLGISLVIAAPTAWWVMHGWLQKFSYHIEIPLAFIAIAGLSTLVLALATISFQSIRAAITNPVESLKNE